jgi:hypothetical protein
MRGPRRHGVRPLQQLGRCPRAKPIELREKEHAIAPHTTQVIDVKCRRGQQLTGGGIEELGHSSATDVEDSHPSGNGWEGSVTNNDTVSHDADAEALCLKK